jgi:hypothetical protein
MKSSWKLQVGGETEGGGEGQLPKVINVFVSIGFRSTHGKFLSASGWKVPELMFSQG